MTDSFEKGKVVKGFKVLDVQDLEEFNGQGIWLEHVRTGLQVFHVYNDDVENLFAFAFRTPVFNSKGTAHVLEHSVLTGSKNYPLKDPFIKMDNQSVNTYLNAYTASDRTVFPASSIVPKDYYNLMSLYGDCVFFPLLRPECFSQEAHHVELDAHGKPVIQGVVYNEMKGAYSSFDDRVCDEIDAALLKGTQYALDSGGDPLVIPTLTHAQLKAFHKKYYCTRNCILFLYGNIPTAEQLEFVDENLLSQITEYGQKASYKKLPEDTIIPFHEAKAPSSENGDTGSTVMVGWKTGLRDSRGVPDFDRLLETLLLNDILIGGDNAPLPKVLIESHLGDDVAPQTGGRFEIQENYVDLGLRGVKKENICKVEPLILKSLEEIAENGLDPKEIERSIHDFEFNNREVKKGSTPYGMVLLRRVLRSWVYGGTPYTSLQVAKAFEKLKEKVLNDSGYVQKKVKELFVDNKKRAVIVVTPDASYSKEREKLEQDNARLVFESKGEKKAAAELKKMLAFQNKPSTPEEDAMLPHLNIKDLTVKPEKVNLVKKQLDGIKLFETKEHSNGIAYIRVNFPIDHVKPEDYKYLPLLTNVVTDCGWKGRNWVDTAMEQCLSMGSFFCAVTPSAVRPGDEANITEDHQGRDILTFGLKVLKEEAQQAFDVVSDCISGVTFEDKKRIRNLIASQRNNGKSSVVPNGSSFAEIRACRFDGRSQAVVELWDGISALYFDRELTRMSVDSVCEKLRSIFRTIRNTGAFIHVTGDADSLKCVEKVLPSFIRKAGICPLKKARKYRDEVFFALTAVEGEDWKKSFASRQTEIFTIPGNSGFAAASIPNSASQKDNWSDIIMCRMLSKGILWEKVRTSGGAYGVYMSGSDKQPDIVYATYRDPKPFSSLQLLQEVLSNPDQVKITDQELSKTVTGCYSTLIAPLSVPGKGGLAMKREMFHYDSRFVENKVKYLISMQCKDLHNSLNTLGDRCVNMRQVVLCSKNMIPAKIKKSSGKILNLPL